MFGEKKRGKKGTSWLRLLKRLGQGMQAGVSARRGRPATAVGWAVLGLAAATFSGAFVACAAATSVQPLTGGTRASVSGPTGAGLRAVSTSAAAAFQSTFTPAGVALRPASCNTQPGFSVGRRAPAGGVRTIVSVFRGKQRGNLRRPVQNKGPPMNDKITFPEMRVVVANPDGKDEMLGVMSREEALARAEDYGMDLVVVSPEAAPPVCKIINYDKLRYENEKKEKAKKKNQSVQHLKEVKLSYKIDVHDFDVRKRAAIKFLTKGDKVKASIRFKGREMAHRSVAESTLNKLMEELKDFGAAERRPSMEGRIMQMTIAPLPDVVKAAEANRKVSKSKQKKGKNAVSEDEEDAEVEAMLAAQDAEEDSEDEDEGHDIDYDIEALTETDVSAKIEEVGDRIRAMKADGAEKPQLASHVEELLALKARFQEITGEAWAAPAASSPA